jgi:hypothetical protein
MLELRPICENCGQDLPPHTREARICSHECTFCATCVDGILENVCPNCGGGFERRPVRPIHNWHGDNDLAHYPAATSRKHRPVDPIAHGTFARSIKGIPADKR